MKHYLHADGNGGVMISKSMITFISLLIMVIMVITQIIVYGVMVKADVENLKDEVVENHEKIDDTYSRGVALRTDFEVLCERIDNMINDVQEIKDDIKEIKEEMN